MKEWQHHVLPPYLPEDLQTLQKILHLIQSVTPQNMLCVENFQATYSDGSWVAGYLKFLSFLLHKTIILPGKTISALKKKEKREEKKEKPTHKMKYPTTPKKTQYQRNSSRQNFFLSFKPWCLITMGFLCFH